VNAFAKRSAAPTVCRRENGVFGERDSTLGDGREGIHSAAQDARVRLLEVATMKIRLRAAMSDSVGQSAAGAAASRRMLDALHRAASDYGTWMRRLGYSYDRVVAEVEEVFASATRQAVSEVTNELDSRIRVLRAEAVQWTVEGFRRQSPFPTTSA
jgi:hypothetical protein